jgi:hypothetical protein
MKHFKPPSSNRARIEEANKQIDRMLADRNDPANWRAVQIEAREALHVHLQFWPMKED